MPDYFVPIDTSFISDYYSKLVQRGILNFFVLSYVDDNRSSLLKKYPDFNKFKNNFQVSKQMIEELISYATEEGLEYNSDDFEASGDYIKLLTKAYVARDLWNTSEFYEIINEENPSVIKAIEVLDGPGINQALLQDNR